MEDILNKIKQKKVPIHVAIIMDGNGRWAKKQGKDRIEGHKAGVESVRNAVKASIECGVKYLTLYAFSTENWKRPKEEVDALMELLVFAIEKEVPELMKNNIRLNAIGNLSSLPEKSQQSLYQSIEITKNNTYLTLTLALSYSSKWEITNACKLIAQKVKQGLLNPEDIDESTIQNHLNTANLPDPELIIRTSGEYRISNFLLWQAAYAEFYFTTVYWPEFTKEEFYKAILDFQKRERRFGKTSEQILSETSKK
ncbi:MAG TPA: isoprenyl transferase [Bacteroidia bacterium]|nr:isoprenyl transferase [Bacteroidia bacterium]